MYRCASCGAFNRVPSERPNGQPTCGKCKATLDLTGAPQAVNAAELERAVQNAPVPVLVDFWAPWCGPCRAVAPAVDQVAREQSGKVLVLKLNTDESPAPSQRLGIRGIPTFIVFKDGAEKARQSGAMPIDALTRWVSSNAR